MDSYELFIASLGHPPKEASELFTKFSGSTTVATAIAQEKNPNKPTKHTESIHMAMCYQAGIINF